MLQREVRLLSKAMKLDESQGDLASQHSDLMKKHADLMGKTEALLDELTAKGRKHIAPSNFAVPSEKKFPIHNISHARNALARASGTKYEAQVKRAVHAKYPSLAGSGK